jgi:hypothetical protein
MKYRLFTLREPLMRLELVGDMVESTPSGGSADQKPPANS